MTIKAIGSKEIGALVSKAIKAVNTAQPLVHAAAVQCMAHAAEHHDVTLAQRLVQGLSADGRKNFIRAEALKKWFQEFSPIGFNGDGKGHERKNPNDRAQLLKPYRVDEANKVPFWDYSPEPEAAAWSAEDFIKAYHALKTKFERMAEEGRIKGDVKAVQAIVTRVEAVLPKIEPAAATPTAAIGSAKPREDAPREEVAARTASVRKAPARRVGAH